ncbi:hypothetical protein V7S43_015296 [Phytophthora oleae]|uniref:PKD/REJ-like domain-containing protein n=1 Tax=Phytophthora oleae TaxID=2107226 RepID=A0ABD3F2K8_9STRA
MKEQTQRPGNIDIFSTPRVKMTQVEVIHMFCAVLDQRSQLSIKKIPKRSMLLVLVNLLLAATLTLFADAASPTRIVWPDLAGMIFPSTSVSQHVQFGDVTSSFSPAFEFIAQVDPPLDCTGTRLCLELQLSSVFANDPFILYRYDANMPIISASFAGHEAVEILPLIPGSRDETYISWWFQSNTTDNSLPEVDLLLRLRQRSQRPSTRDQLLVQIKVELVDSHTATSTMEVYSIYGNQRVTTDHTRRINSNTFQVGISISKNDEKREVGPGDAYPLVVSENLDLSSAFGTSCSSCGDFLDACDDIEVCKSVLLPCLLSQLEGMVTDGSGDSTNGKRQMDFLRLLATCAANYPVAAWAPIRKAIFCLERFQCALGTAEGSELPATLRLTNGTQKFTVVPLTMGTDFVDLTIETNDIRPAVVDMETFTYSASASFLDTFLRSFVLSQSAKVSAFVENYAADPNYLEVTLNYSEALMLKSIEFHTMDGQVNMLEDSPAQGRIEYSDSSSRPNLDIILDEIRARVNPPSGPDHSWILSDDCLACSALLFDCSTVNVANNSCNYYTMTDKFGKCMKQQMPPALFEAMITGTIIKRPVTTEISRCLKDISTSTSDNLHNILKANSRLACFAATQCPFGPIALVQDARAIVLETTSYIQLVRITLSLMTTGIKIKFKVGQLLIATSASILVSMSGSQIQQIIGEALSSTGMGVSVSTSIAGHEWTLDIIYRHVFFGEKFTADAVINDNSVGSDTMNQFVMEGGASQLRAVARDASKIFKESTAPTGTLSQGDGCQKCAPALARCLDKAGCKSFVWQILVPSLRRNNTNYQLDLVPPLESILPVDFDYWDDIAAEFYCLAEVRCDLEYDNVVDTDTTSSTSSMAYHRPTFLNLNRIQVKWEVRTYTNTQWILSTSTGNFTYKPDTTGTSVSTEKSAEKFMNWVIKTMTNEAGMNCQQAGNWSIDGSGAVGVIDLYGPYDSLLNRVIMAPLKVSLSLRILETSPISTTLPPPGVIVTPWTLAMSSSGMIQRGKLLDLLKFGADIIPSDSTSTITTSPTKFILPTDPCRSCTAASVQCQRNLECVTFSRGPLVSLLRQARDSTAIDLSDEHGNVRIAHPLGSDLYSLASTKLHSLEGWRVLASELSCFAQHCDLEYRDILSPEQNVHDPSYLSIDKRTITLIVTTSADTEWRMKIGVAVTTYAPSSSSLPLYDAAVAFCDWIKNVVMQTIPCVFTGGEPFIDEAAAIATFEITLDTLATEKSLMVAPLVPVLEATGGTTAGAQVVVKPWEISLWAVNHMPQYSKLIDLLALGFVEVPYTSDSTGTQAPSQSPTPTPTGSGVYECAECTENLRVCREDSECEPALQAMVVLFYEKMIGSSTFDATAVMKDTIFHSISSTETRVKLLQLLTCSSSYCIQKSCDIGETGETTQLKIAPALTKFYVKEGDNITIHGVQNDTYEYTENNDAAALSSYLDTTVLSSYAALDIRVTATVTEDILDATLQVYVITFEGLNTPLHFTWRNAPPDSLFTDSFDSFTAFTFKSSTGDMVNVFKPWLDWVSTGNSTSTSTPTPSPNSIAVLSSSDSCRQCTDSLLRCQADTECSSYSRQSLLPFLRESLEGAPYSNYQVDLAPILQAFGAYDPHAFSSNESWHALSDELYCIAHSDCDLAYDDGNGYNPHVFSDLKMEVMSVTLVVRTYSDTKWKVDMNGTVFYYTPHLFMPPGMPGVDMTVPAFQNWIKQLGESQDMEIHVDGWEEDQGAAKFYVKLDGGYDTISDRYTLLSPALIPVFSVVEDATGDPPASVTTRPWVLYFSSPERPKYGKFLDLLGYGISGATVSAPTPASTLASPNRDVSADDQCNKCASVFARCQADSNCVSLSAEVVSILQSTPLTLETESIDAFGSAAYTGDLYPVLLEVGISVKNVGSAWDFIAAELSCLAYDPCNVEYSDVHVTVERTYTPVVVDLSLTRASVNIELRTYADTPVEISVKNHQFIYTPSGGDIVEAAVKLRSWFEALNDDVSMPLEVQVVQTRMDTEAETPTFTLSIRFFGAFDDELYRYMMVNPMLFPIFTTTTTSSRTDPFTPDLNTTVPKLMVSSKYVKPQYSRMLDMLSNGISGSSSVTPEPTPTSATRTIQANDPCRNCASIVSSCRDDVDCLEASQNSLVSLLTSSEMRMNAVPTSEDGVAQVSLNMSSALYSTILRASDDSYSIQAWTLLLDELSCLSATFCDLEYDDVVSPFLPQHVPTSLIILEPSVIISLRTFVSTEWKMWVADNEYSYPGSSDGNIRDATEAFSNWIISKLSVSSDFEANADDPVVDSESQSATVTLHYHRTTSIPATQMVPPWQVPRFEAVGGTVGGGDTGLPAVYAKVDLWEVEMMTTGQKPQFGKFVDILTNGFS